MEHPAPKLVPVTVSAVGTRAMVVDDDPEDAAVSVGAAVVTVTVFPLATLLHVTITAMPEAAARAGDTHVIVVADTYVDLAQGTGDPPDGVRAMVHPDP